MMFYHIIRCLSIPLCIYNCRFFSFHYYVTSFVFYQKQNDHESSSFWKLARNKWICQETCDIFFVINFLKFFDNPFQNVLFLKEFLACNGCFGLFTKIKKGSWTSFWCTFSPWFFHKIIPYYNLSMDKVSMSYFFPSQDIKQNVWLSSYLDNWWCHKL